MVGSVPHSSRKMLKNINTKKLVSVIIICLLALLAITIVQINTTSKEVLAVYIGAHPDDIELGMGGSLFKNDLNKHPILWIVATDGGADSKEYDYESLMGWVKNDGAGALWAAPNGDLFFREFFSEDLSIKRCGINGSYQHPYLLGESYDWKTRVSLVFGSSVVAKVQLSYLDPNNPNKRIFYPDGGLHFSKTEYTAELATDIANEINKVVTANGYSKDLLYINSHAFTEVAINSNEHKTEDHEIVGNAVKESINFLHTKYDFGMINVSWYTIYSPIEPNPTYLVNGNPLTRYQEDISAYAVQKSDLCKTLWESAFMDFVGSFDRALDLSNTEGYWNDYPNDPGNYEYKINIDYPA